MSDTVMLDDFEMRMCGYVGKARFADAEAQKRDHGEGPSSVVRTPERDIVGARAEFAASIILNMFWRPHVGDIYRPDVGGCVEVRSTVEPPGRGHLIIKPKAGDYPYVLIEVSGNCFHFAGWMQANIAKRNYGLKCAAGQDPAHWVPQRDLNDLTSLRALLQREAA